MSFFLFLFRAFGARRRNIPKECQENKTKEVLAREEVDNYRNYCT